MDKEIYLLLKERDRLWPKMGALPINVYGHDLCSRILSSLIRKRALSLGCNNEIVHLPDIEAVRLIQQKERNATCYCRDKPYAQDKFDVDRCGAPKCLWKTSCEISRNKYRKVFISYAHGDADLARDVSRRLRKKGVPVWYDVWEIGSHLRDEFAYPRIHEALSHVDAVLVLETELYHREKNPPMVNFSYFVKVDRALKPYLDFEEHRWIDSWHEGAYFKVIVADCGAAANDTSAFNRRLLKKIELTYWGSQVSRVKGQGYDYYEENFPINVVPAQINTSVPGYGFKESDDILGEEVHVPLDSPQLLKELEH